MAMRDSPDCVLRLHPERRPAETAVQDALRAFDRHTVPRPRAGRDAATTWRARRAPVAEVGLATAVLAATALTVLVLAPGARASGCEPIRYAFGGVPTAEARAEFAAAAGEIHRHSGFTFEQDNPKRATLHVNWSAAGVTVADQTELLPHGRTRAIGFAQARWRDANGARALADATIEVDATRSWSFGLDRGDSLAAVFVHELGHVIGLPHSDHPTSFMRARISAEPPRWTDDERAVLAEAGRRAGCDGVGVQAGGSRAAAPTSGASSSEKDSTPHWLPNDSST